MPLEILILAEHFWPPASPFDIYIQSLAERWQLAGARVTVLATAACPFRPQKLHLGEITVTRVPGKSSGMMRSFRLWRAVRPWMAAKAQAAQVPVVCFVAGMRKSAALAVDAASRLCIPVVLQPQGSGRGGDLWWQIHTNRRRGLKAACQRARWFIAGTHAQQAELLAAGYRRESISLIARGFPEVEPYDPTATASQAVADLRQEAKRNAREALLRCSGEFVTLGDCRVAVSVLDFSPHSNWVRLIECWPKVLKQYPHARLWLIGAGPEHRQALLKIRELNLQQTIACPGTFDHLDDLLAAADVYLQPDAVDRETDAVHAALAMQVPVLASEAICHRLPIVRKKGQAMPEKSQPWITAIVAHLTKKAVTERVLAQGHEDDPLGMPATEVEDPLPAEFAEPDAAWPGGNGRDAIPNSEGLPPQSEQEPPAAPSDLALPTIRQSAENYLQLFQRLAYPQGS